MQIGFFFPFLQAFLGYRSIHCLMLATCGTLVCVLGPGVCIPESPPGTRLCVAGTWASGGKDGVERKPVACWVSQHQTSSWPDGGDLQEVLPKFSLTLSVPHHRDPHASASCVLGLEVQCHQPWGKLVNFL